jgi:N-acetylglutamate synthase-like GNAT family acetyltransferase
MGITVRRAEETELKWVNEKYDEVDFVHSNFANELIAIAEVDGKKAGVGRLISVDEHNGELSGMYVFDEFRGLGVSKHIISFLLENKGQLTTIFCLPFAHLENLYKAFGFERCVDTKNVPKKVSEKFEWCNKHYEHEVLLLVKGT